MLASFWFEYTTLFFVCFYGLLTLKRTAMDGELALINSLLSRRIPSEMVCGMSSLSEWEVKQQTSSRTRQSDGGVGEAPVRHFEWTVNCAPRVPPEDLLISPRGPPPPSAQAMWIPLHCHFTCWRSETPKTFNSDNCHSPELLYVCSYTMRDSLYWSQIKYYYEAERKCCSFTWQFLNVTTHVSSGRKGEDIRSNVPFSLQGKKAF